MLDIFSKLLLHKKLKFEKGQIILLEQNVSIIPLEYLINLHKTLGVNENLLYKSAKVMGFNWFTNMYKSFKIDRHDVLDWGVKILSVAGWGDIKVVKIDRTKKVYQVEAHNSSEALAYGKSDLPKDHFIRGCFAAGGTVIFDTACDCVEKNCIAKGDKFCEFIVKPTDTFDKTDPLVKNQLF